MSPKPQVYLWGGGVLVPTCLPAASSSRMVSVAIGRTQRAAITEDGKLIFWELSSGSMMSTRFTTQQARPTEAFVFVPRPVAALSTATIKKVACGDMFTACLTDKGILMTFGSGVNGCLGHGDFHDAAEPRLVQAMLAHQTMEVACGPNHVVAVTAADVESPASVFAWGKGDSGQLGLGDRCNHASPQEAPLPEDRVPKTVCCGPDCSLVITDGGKVLATGSNRYNKLALDVEASSIKAPEGGSTEDPDQEVAEQKHKFQITGSTLSGSAVVVGRSRELPSLMSNSFMLSSLHPPKMMATNSGSGTLLGSRPLANLWMGASVGQTSEESQNGKGTVDEVLRFQVSTSDLLRQGRIESVSSGTNHTAFLTDIKECITCGDNTYGQLGYQSRNRARIPDVVTALRGKAVERVACGDFFTVACTTAGEVYSWGRGRRGRLGREIEHDVCEPQPIEFEKSHSVHSVACSHGVTMLLSVTKN